jgi:hypothetical protein
METAFFTSLANYRPGSIPVYLFLSFLKANMIDLNENKAGFPPMCLPCHRFKESILIRSLRDEKNRSDNKALQT